MIRRTFLIGWLATAARKRKRRRVKRAPPNVPNEVEKRQLLQSFTPAQIQTALDVRFLGLWSAEELERELQKRGRL